MDKATDGVLTTAAIPDSEFSELLIVLPDSGEAQIMWDRLAMHRLNVGLENPYSAEYFGEVWQYMESVKSLFGYKHLFRHRLHPRTKSRVCLSIRASIGLTIKPNDTD